MHQFLLTFALSALGSIILATGLASLAGRLGFPLPGDTGRLGAVDGLRGYLALSVMLHHFYIWIQSTRLGGTWGGPEIPVFNQLGAGGVALFFMATGLVFYPRILAGLRSTSWSAVYISRIFRIMPLVTISVSIVTAIILLRTGASMDLSYIGAAARWISTWAEVPILGYPDSGRINAYVLWSLKYEWIFYILILPLSAAGMDAVRSRGWPAWILPAALFTLALGIRLTVWLAGISFDFPRYLLLFAVGMLAFECQSRPRWREALAKPWIGAVAIGALVAGAVTTQFPYGASLPLFSFFFVCVACGNSLFGLLRSRGARVLGECSFGIYLLHGIVLDVAFVDGGAFVQTLPTAALPLLLFGAVAVIVPLTAMTYLLIERPMIGLGKAAAWWLAGRRNQLDRRQLEIAP